MNSPIKTIIKNKTKRQYVITCIPRRRIVINAGSSCEIYGDVFSQCENSRSISTLLEQMTAGDLEISFVVDSVFSVKSEGEVLVIQPHIRRVLSGVKEKLSDLAEEPEKLEQEETSALEPKQEEPKQEEPKQEEPKQEEPKQEEPKQEIGEAETKSDSAEVTPKEEDVKMSEAAEETVKEKVEEPKKAQQAKPADKPKAPKKVQVK